MGMEFQFGKTKMSQKQTVVITAQQCELFNATELPLEIIMYACKHAGSVAQSCPTLCGPMNCGLPGQSGIFQAKY